MITNWELNTLFDNDLAKLQDALEGMWLDGQKAFPSWIVPLHDAIISEWHRRELTIAARAPVDADTGRGR